MTWLSDGNPLGEDPEARPQYQAPEVPAVTVDAGRTDGRPWALAVAIVWAIAAISIGLYFVFGVTASVYGGDAYTGIEAAIVTAIKAVGWLIVSSGVLGVVIAGSRTIWSLKEKSSPEPG